MSIFNYLIYYVWLNIENLEYKLWWTKPYNDFSCFKIILHVCQTVKWVSYTGRLTFKMIMLIVNNGHFQMTPDSRSGSLYIFPIYEGSQSWLYIKITRGTFKIPNG